MEWQQLNDYINPTCLAVFGGIIGALRTSLKDTHKAWCIRLLDIATAAILAASTVDYFVADNFPKMALALGLVVGSIGANLIEAISALTPNIAKGLIDGILAHFGYQAKRPPD